MCCTNGVRHYSCSVLNVTTSIRNDNFARHNTVFLLCIILVCDPDVSLTRANLLAFSLVVANNQQTTILKEKYTKTAQATLFLTATSH